MQSSHEPAPQVVTPEEIDIRYWIHHFLSHWYLFLIAVVICLGAAFLYLKITPTTYSTSATILLRDGAASDPLEALGSPLSGMLGKGPTTDDEMEIIRSKGLTKWMIQELGLEYSTFMRQGLRYVDVYGKEPIKVLFPPQFLDALRGSFQMDIAKQSNGSWNLKALQQANGQKQEFTCNLTSLVTPVETPWGLIHLTEVPAHLPTDGTTYRVRIVAASPKATLERYNSALQVSQTSKKTNAIRISTQGENLQKSEAIVNKMVELYNRDGLMEKNQTSLQLAQFINERLQLLSQELTTVEQDVESYRKKHQLADISSQSKLFIESASEYDAKVAEIDIQYSLILFIENYLKQGEQREMIPGTNALSDPALTALVAEYNNVTLEMMRLERSTNADNPMVQQKQLQLQLLRTNILKSIENAKSSAEITRRDLLARGKLYEQKIEGIPTIEREFVEMARQQAIKQELYLFLLKKREETQLTLASATNATRVIDPAYSSMHPIAPKKQIILLMAFCMGIFLAAAFLWATQMLHDKVNSVKEISRLTHAPVLGELSQTKGAEGVVMQNSNYRNLAEQFRKLRANLNFVLPNTDQKVVLITSSEAREGKSFTAINLAAALSLLDKKVAVVGLDLRRPMFKQYLHVDPRYGVTNFLTDQSLTLDDLKCHIEGYDHLTIFTSGSIPPNPSELLESPRFAGFMEQLRAEFDYIVMDSAPIGMAADSFTLAEHADAVLYVCRLGVCSRPALKHLDGLIDSRRLTNVSLLINGVESKRGYGYYYGGGYY